MTRPSHSNGREWLSRSAECVVRISAESNDLRNSRVRVGDARLAESPKARRREHVASASALPRWRAPAARVHTECVRRVNDRENKQQALFLNPSLLLPPSPSSVFARIRIKEAQMCRGAPSEDELYNKQLRRAGKCSSRVSLGFSSPISPMQLS